MINKKKNKIKTKWDLIANPPPTPTNPNQQSIEYYPSPLPTPPYKSPVSKSQYTTWKLSLLSKTNKKIDPSIKYVPKNALEYIPEKNKKIINEPKNALEYKPEKK